eukprot:TRINITY_DN9151_c0_g1_i1.p1 TRINITY_DN9151_c0_g1~~TRINITY_DN9151_c0_g1_i1.p1  ORF type:complete len:575 (-),score=129.37 TRINITY_DN9151_c0_g1_i1:21-1745(-)
MESASEGPSFPFGSLTITDQDLKTYAPYAQSLTDLIAEFKFLHVHENVSFFSKDIWSYVPDEWKEPLLALSVAELQQLSSGFVKEEWPTSLKSFVSRCLSLRLPRHAAHASVEKNSVEEANTILDLAIKHEMKEKKRHEVIKMSRLTKEVCKSVGAKTVVDIGAGEGYISHYLAHKYGLDVIAIESNSAIVESGAKRMQTVNRLYRGKRKREREKMEQEQTLENDKSEHQTSDEQHRTNKKVITTDVNDEPEALPQFVTKTLTNSNLHEITEMIRKKDEETTTANSESTTPVFAFIGLHTCGNLANMLIQLFLKSDATALIDVGCCYHVEIDEGRMGLFGDCARVFPLSKIVQGMKPCIQWCSMKIATQASFRYTELGTDDSAVSCKTLAYRSVIEVVLNKHLSNFSNSESSSTEKSQTSEYRVKRVNGKHYTDFDVYIKEVCKRFCTRDRANKKWMNSSAIVEKLLPEFQDAYKQYSAHFKNLVVFIALQMCLAPILETLIVLDRMIYICEQGVEAGVAISAGALPIFDPSVSPRNLALLAVKNSNLIASKDYIGEVVGSIVGTAENLRAATS